MSSEESLVSNNYIRVFSYYVMYLHIHKPIRRKRQEVFSLCALSQILSDEGHQVLFDGSATKNDTLDAKQLYKKKSALDLSELEILSLYKEAERLKDLTQTGAKTIKAVAMEMDTYLNHLQQKTQWFNNLLSENTHRDKSSSYHASELRLAEGFSEATFSYNKSLKKVNKNLLIPEQSKAHMRLQDRVFAYSGREDIFINYGVEDTKMVSDVDERLYAACLYTSIYEKKPVDLFTADSDFVRLQSAFCMDNKDNFSLRYALETNPINIYFFKNDLLRSVSSSSEALNPPIYADVLRH